MTGARKDRNIKIGAGKKKSTSSPNSTSWSRPAEGRKEVAPAPKAQPRQNPAPRRDNNRNNNRGNNNRRSNQTRQGNRSSRPQQNRLSWKKSGLVSSTTIKLETRSSQSVKQRCCCADSSPKRVLPHCLQLLGSISAPILRHVSTSTKFLA